MRIGSCFSSAYPQKRHFDRSRSRCLRSAERRNPLLYLDLSPATIAHLPLPVFFHQPTGAPSVALYDGSDHRCSTSHNLNYFCIVVSVLSSFFETSAGVGSCDRSQPPPSASISVTEAVISCTCRLASVC